MTTAARAGRIVGTSADPPAASWRKTRADGGSRWRVGADGGAETNRHGRANLGDADVAHWPEAIGVLQAMRPAIVVPGHENRLDPAQLDHTLALLAAPP